MTAGFEDASPLEGEGRRPAHAAISERLEELRHRAATSGSLPISVILRGFGRSGFGFVLLVFSLPPLIPIPGPFGFVFGAALAIIGVQMMLGARRVWLPDIIARREVPAGLVAGMLDKSISLFQRLGTWLKPGRMRWLNSRLGQRLTGLPIVILAVIIALPIPLGNLAPAMAMILLSLALIERDGLAQMVALGLATVAIAWTLVLVFLLGQGVVWLL